MAPSALLFPTLHSQCFIEVTIVYDSYPKETHYELVEIIDITSEENEFLISRNASVGDTSQTESFCLVEGDYEFAISDIYGVCMLCMYGRILKYNITTANDELILEGRGDLEWSVRAIFFAPIHSCFPRHQSIVIK
jgi:hypothetical protein